MSRSFLLRWAEEALTTPVVENPVEAALDSRPGLDMAQGQAALEFIRRAGARLVCPWCWPDCPPGTPLAVLVPPENDGLFFRAAVTTLGLDRLPIIPRRAPLGFRPEEAHLKRRGV